MQRASRQEHGPLLEATILAELNDLQRDHPNGFVVRLHVLGDFYSAEYVAMWRGALEEFPALRVFGYTAWTNDTEIGSEVARTRERHWDRFAVRTSGAAPVKCLSRSQGGSSGRNNLSSPAQQNFFLFHLRSVLGN